MKKILIILTTAFIVSCGGKAPSIDELLSQGDKKAIAAKKTELNNQKATIEENLQKIQDYQNEHGDQPINTQVSTMTVNDTLFDHFVELQGSVDTKQNITIMPEMSGLLTQVYVKEGQKVAAGQILAKIDDGGLSQQIQQMQVQEQLAKTTFERQKRLWDQNIGSEIQYLQAKANYEGQSKAISSMQRTLSKTTVRAPFAGTIDDVITEQGNVVSPGMTALFRLVSLKDMYINVDVPETYITSIKKGTEVNIEFPVLSEKMKSTIRQTSSYINPANRSFSIEIPVENKSGNIKPNLTARLKINDYTSENAILVPLSVISENQDGEQYVMIVDESEDGLQAIRRKVITGKSSGDFIEIIEGLKKGDQVITEGARTVREGQLIDIKNSL
ncbi:efflux RND transporter periplasmic adaptor subunit [Nonlabens mediterrranea]|uniref:Efflux RND transporter periplasmic adaptor subunit n=1 Tax=Nonlabens mediterrranea TaxID=1419947 RepID=A0ABS0A9I6_9FLAO|nr:efflux RND transporter periplasmic adaptor subunit [Nonlabens mediterrranea]